jgi:hypothetical protein
MARKKETLSQWRNLPANQNPLKVMRPEYHNIRIENPLFCTEYIDGNAEFVDAVLSNLKSLLDGENAVTRLELCYIRLHMRGGEAAAMESIFGSADQKAATVRYAQLVG